MGFGLDTGVGLSDQQGTERVTYLMIQVHTHSEDDDPFILIALIAADSAEDMFALDVLLRDMRLNVAPTQHFPRDIWG